MATSGLPDTPLKTMDNPSVESRLKYPGEWWKNFDDGSSEMIDRVVRSLEGADVVAISDSDVDGLGCLAVLKNAFHEERFAPIPSGHGATITPVEAASLVVKHAPGTADVYVTDICPNDPGEVDEDDDEGSDAKKLSKLLSVHPGDVYVFDHHEWGDTSRSLLSDVATTLDVRSFEDEADKVCAANITFEYVEDRLLNRGESIHAKMEELVAVTRDHDLYVKEDERSDVLSDFQFEFDEFEYVESVAEHGVDVINDPDVQQALEEARREKNMKIEAASKRADWRRVVVTEHGDVEMLAEGETLAPFQRAETVMTVALAYGNMYVSGLGKVLTEGWAEWFNEDSDDYTHEELVPELDYSTSFRPGDADLVVAVPPWNKVSFRSSEEFPICHILAERVGNGGGHDCAAGCKPGIVGTEISYKWLWDTEGQYVKAKVMDEILDAVEDGLLDGIEKE